MQQLLLNPDYFHRVDSEAKKVGSNVQYAQLKRPGIACNTSCALGDWLTSRPEGCSQPKESWFADIDILI